MSGFQPSITIQDAIDRVQRNEYLLPAFQREFKWSTNQIENLFDSIMREYPISSMLFWKVRGDTKTEFKFYRFLDKYVEIHETHNKPMNTDNLNDFYAILDGQQRLTALNIGLRGTFAYKKQYLSRKNTPRSFPDMTLYLDIAKTHEEDESENKYRFRFIENNATNTEDLYKKDDAIWFKVGRILSLNRKEDYNIDDFIEDNNLSKESKDIIRLLYYSIHEAKVINYYKEEDQIPDKAVDIFVRINSGGTGLSFADILFTIAIADWRNVDARTEINELIDSINNDGFNIDKEYVLKSFLYLHHKDIKSKVNSFNREFIKKIEENWSKIRDSIINLFELMKVYGLNNHTLAANNATLPILYYLYHKDIYNNFSKSVKFKDDRSKMRDWLFATLIRKTFSASSDTRLAQARRVFTKNIVESKIYEDIDSFPSENIVREIRGGFDIGDDYLEELLTIQKGSRYSFAILAMLYPNLDYRNYDFHEDHLHPRSKYNNLPEDVKEKYTWKDYNSIINLQMLDGNENSSKNDASLEEWVNRSINEMSDRENSDTSMLKSDFLKKQLIPDVNLDIMVADKFFEARKELLISRLRKILNLDSS